MNDIDMVEKAMLKAQKAQLGFAFIERYLRYRKDGQTPHSAIRLFEQEFGLTAKPEPSSIMRQIGSAVSSCLTL